MRNRWRAQQKESSKWDQSVARSAQAAGALEGSLVIRIGDREAESHELFLQHQQERAAQKQGATRHELLMRCQHDRGRVHDADGLFSHLQKQPVAARMSVTVPPWPGHKARAVTLAIRFAPVRFGSPVHQVKYRGQSEEIALWALSAQGGNPGPGCDAICWRLLSTLPVEDAAGAITQVQRYSQRWQLELFHKILKSGCRIEARQFGSAERIGRCLVLDVIVAPFGSVQGTRAHPRAEPRRTRGRERRPPPPANGSPSPNGRHPGATPPAAPRHLPSRRTRAKRCTPSRAWAVSSAANTTANPA